MREIEFRGKRINNGEWVYGSYVEAKQHWHGRGKHEDWIFRNVLQNGGWIAVTGRYAVITETVGQYTGLKDKNGVKIYEGDAIKRAYGNFHNIVEYKNGGFEPLVVKGWECESDASDYMVIGNIHDNPELLGGAE